MGKIIINTAIEGEDISSEFDIDASGNELISAAAHLALNALELVLEKEKLEYDDIASWVVFLLAVNNERHNQDEKIPESDHESETGKKEV